MRCKSLIYNECESVNFCSLKEKKRAYFLPDVLPQPIVVGNPPEPPKMTWGRRLWRHNSDDGTGRRFRDSERRRDGCKRWWRRELPENSRQQPPLLWVRWPTGIVVGHLRHLVIFFQFRIYHFFLIRCAMFIIKSWVATILKPWILRLEYKKTK